MEASGMATPRAPKLTLVVAAAGYGKTTTLRRLFPGPAVAWHRGVDPGALGTAGLARLAGTATQLVLEDLPAMPDRVGQAMLDAVAQLPAPVSLAISSRYPVGSAAAGWLARPAPTQLRPADLALTTDQVGELLDAEFGLSSPDLAERVVTVTAGWPALVRLVAETLRSSGVPDGPLLPAVTEPGGLVASYLAEEVLGGLPAAVRRLLRDLADLAPVTAGLASALGYPEAAREIGVLTRTGLLTHAATDPDTGPRVVPVVAAVAGHGEPPVAASTLDLAAAWYDRHGPARAAARTFWLAGDAQRCARVLAERGEAMIATGRPGTVAELIAALPAELRTRRLRLLAGDALRTAGDVAAAAREYEQVAAGEPAWDAGLAWRMGLIHYLRGDQPAALACFARSESGSPADRALLLAWTAAATARHGDATTGAEHARHAYRLAAEAGHDGALATAHIGLALCLGLTGDQLGSEEHYQLARQVAERAGDLVLLARILTNQSYHLSEQARYADAGEVAGRAVRYAEAAGHANLTALATGNQASALVMLGRYDEAAERYRRVLARYRQMGSRRCAGALIGLGELHRLRGWREQARAAFEEAVQLADAGGSRELAVRAMAGLARVLLADDPTGAARYADDAVRQATDGVRLPARLARGWVSVAEQDWQAVRQVAGETVRLARDGGNRAGLAEALELRAVADADPGRAREALREAHAIWTDAGAVVNAARTLVGLSRLPGATADDRFAALLAAERLTAAQIPLDPAGTVAAATAPAARPAGADVVLKTLGRFEVWVAGRAVPPAAWQSRRARDLLRILVARRGRPVPRGELCELLWPDDDPDRTGHRLSVLLSIVRGVLDPGKLFPSDHYLVADPASVALDVTPLRVDVLEFLAAVAHGRRLLDRGASDAAATALAAAVAEYPADVFEDEPYDDWSAGLREQARAAYLAAMRLLARSHLAAKATGPAVDCLLRLLEKDRYDEPAHRALVRALVAGGQHGEARRAFERYREAMRAIGVRLPDPDLLAARDGGGSVVVVGLDPRTGERPVLIGRTNGRHQPGRQPPGPGPHPDRPHGGRPQVRSGGQQRVDEHVGDRALDPPADPGHRVAGAGNRRGLR
jgi:DNA-binding SARP family transcriptional activator